MGGNPFYSNAEAYAYEILQQKLLKEAQRSAQQTVMELSALKALFNQGQFIYCIPFGGSPPPGHSPPFSFCPPFPAFCPPEPLHLPLPAPPPPPPPPPPPAAVPPCPPSPPPPLHHHHHHHHQPSSQSVVRVNVKNCQAKLSHGKTGTDECNLGEAGIEVTVDLREYLPAEISLDVEERSLEIRACHVDPQGRKTFARRYDLPACIALDSVKCVLSHDGFLLFSAAWLKME